MGNTFQLELRQALHFQRALKPSGAPSCVGAPIIDKHASSFIISSQYGSMLADFRFHRSQLGSPIIRQDTMFALHRNWCPFHRFVLVEKKKCGFYSYGFFSRTPCAQTSAKKSDVAAQVANRHVCFFQERPLFIRSVEWQNMATIPARNGLFGLAYPAG